MENAQYIMKDYTKNFLQKTGSDIVIISAITAMKYIHINFLYFLIIKQQP